MSSIIPASWRLEGRDTREVEANARAILHVDLDSFFVSVERVLNPSLASRPVIVGGSAESRGVVCSASREARSLGVSAGMPTATARRLCPDATFLPGRGRLYARAAASAQRVLRDFADVVERASIDEAYLDITDRIGPARSALDLGADIQRALARKLGLPSSIGIGSNKLIAKVACQRAKPEGIVEIWPGYEEAFLAPLPVGELPGVGPVMAERLRLFGLTTVSELARVDASILEATFGAWGRQLAQQARGGGRAELSTDETPKSLGAERTFPHDIGDSETLLAEIHSLADTVTGRLRRHAMRAGSITLKLRTADFKTITRSRTLPSPTDHASEIAGIASFLLRDALSSLPVDGGGRNVNVRLLGIQAGHLGSGAAQAPLFDAASTQLSLVRSRETPGASRGLVIRWRKRGEPATDAADLS